MMKNTFTKFISCALSAALAMGTLTVPSVNLSAGAVSEALTESVYDESETILTTTSCPDDLTRTTTTTTNAVTEITTTTAPQESFKKLISFVDSESGEYIGCIDAKVLLVGRVFNEETQHWEYTDEFEIVDEWNTTDSNPHQMNDLKITDNSLGYRIIVEKLPEDYYYGGSNWTYVRTNITQTDGNMEIAIKHVEPDEYTYPLSGTWVADVKVVNVKTGEYISGVKCKAVDLENNEIVDTWTSDNDTHRIDNLRFTFESQVSYDSENSYGIWVSDIPEIYRLYAGLTDEGESDANHILINYPMFEFQKNEFELVCPVRLENINDPVETTSTTTFCADDLTKTTTTTTTSFTETTTTTAPQDRYLSYTFSIVDKDTGKLVPNLDVKFIKIVDSRGSVAAIRDGNYTVIDEWNTGDGVAHDVAEFNAGIPFPTEYYAIYIEQLPDTYFDEYSSEKYVIRGSFGRDESGHYSYSVAVRYVDTEGYPLDGIWSANIQAVDAKTKQPIVGVNVRVEDPDTGEVLDEWVTTDEAHHIDGLKYHFDTPLDESFKAIQYMIYFSGFPEEYYTENYGQGENGEVYTDFCLSKWLFDKNGTENVSWDFGFEDVNNPVEDTTGTTTSAIQPSVITSTTTTTAAVEYFASIDEMVEMAKKDYQSKTGVNPASAEGVLLEDGSLSITMYDETGALLETYVIDPVTGNGKAQGGDDVELPQTGLNTTLHGMMIWGALALTGAGILLVAASENRRRRRSKQM